jgi:universal stress protein A
MFTRILVPTDFSEPSDAALDYARVVAGRFGASLHLLHVVEVPGVMMGPDAYIADVPGVEARCFEDARARLQDVLTPHDRTRYKATTDVVAGTSARSILDYAREQGIDLIVMGTHGRGGFSHLLMGSVAEKVVRQAACPVMTVRQPLPAVHVPEQLQRAWIQTGG